MNNLSYRIGYWSAIFLLITFIVWIISFIGIALSSPLFQWTNLEEYLIYVRSTNRYFQNTAFLFMLLCGPVYLILINSFYEYASKQNKVLVRLSMLFGLAFAITSGINYFVQLSAVRHTIEKGNFDGLEYFIQANPDSIMTSTAMLGWTLFLALSSFFIVPAFRSGGLEKVLRIAFLTNGISCFLAGIGYILHIDVLTFLCINVGVGGSMITISISSVKLFYKLNTQE